MKVVDLMNWLSTLPPETEIAYRDMNYGGPLESFLDSHIELKKGIVLVDSLLWEDCEEEE